MAGINARELLLIVRAQNQASNVLRKVAVDARALGRISALQLRQQQLSINRANQQLQIDRAANRLARLQAGTTRGSLDLRSKRLKEANLALESRIARQAAARRNLQATINAAHNRQLDIDSQIYRKNTDLLKLDRRRKDIARTITRLRKQDANARTPGRLQSQLDARVVNARNIQSAKDDIASLGRAYAEQESIVQRSLGRFRILNKEWLRTAASAQSLEQRTRNLSFAEQEHAKHIAEANKQLALSQQRLAKTRAEMALLDKQIKAARWDRFGTAARTIGHFGRVAQLGGLVVGASLAYAANMAANFSTQVTLAATQSVRLGSNIENVATNADKLGDVILRIMPQSISSTEDLTSATYDLFSSLDTVDKTGRKAYLTIKDGARILKAASQAAIAGQTDTSTAASGLIYVLNQFPQQGKNLTRTLDLMFAAVRFGRTTFAELSTSLETVAPAANAAGQSFEQMLAAFAFGTRRLGVAKARVGYARLLETLSSPKFIEGLGKLGVSITDVDGKLLPLDKTIGILIKAFPDLQKGGFLLQNFFKLIGKNQSTVQARRLFTALVKNFGEFQQFTKRIPDDTGEFVRSFRALSKTPGVKWKQFINQLKALAIAIGLEVIPVITQLSKHVERLLKWWQELDDSTKDQIVRWTTYGAAIALVGGTVLAVGGALLGIVAILGRLGILFKSITALTLAFLAAVKLIKGEWRGATDLMRSFVNLASSSLPAIIVSSLAVAAAVRKIAAAWALASTAAVLSRGGAATAAEGGLLASMFARGRKGAGNLKFIKDYAKEGKNLRKITLGAAAALSLIPGPTWAIAGAMGAAAGGLYLWNKRAEEAADKTEELNVKLSNLKALGSAASTAAARLGNLVGDSRQVQRGTLALRDINRQILTLRKQLNAKDTTKGQKRQIQDQIESLILDRADIRDALDQARANQDRSFNALTVSLGRQFLIFKRMGARQKDIENAKKRLRELQSMTVIDIAETFGRGNFGAWEKAIERQQKIINGFAQNIRQLRSDSERAGNILRNNFFKVIGQLQNQRVLPKDLSKRQITDAFKLAQSLGRMLTKQELRLFFKAYIDKKTFNLLPKQIQEFITSNKADEVRVKAKVSLTQEQLDLRRKKFGLPIVQDVKPKAKLSAFGQLRKDIGQLFKPINQNVRFSMPTAAERNAVALGQSVAMGVARGITDNTGIIEAAMASAMAAAEETARISIQAKSPSRVFAKVGKDIIAGAAKGVERNSRTLQAATSKAMKDAGKKGKKEGITLADILALGGDDDTGGAKKTADKAKQIYDQWASDVEQIAEHLASVWEDTASRMKDAFGQLFGGPIATGRVGEIKSEFGIPLSPKDLIQDLKAQVRAFRSWRSDISRLARRGIPSELLADLEALGPEAAKNIQTLSRMTPKELRNYVRTWQNGQRLIKRETVKAFNQQVSVYRGVGRSMALEMIRGFKDMTPQLVSWFKSLAGEIVGPTPPKPPSDAKKPKTTNPTAVPNPKQPAERSIQMFVTANHPKEALETTLARADFKLRMMMK